MALAISVGRLPASLCVAGGPPSIALRQRLIPTPSSSTPAAAFNQTRSPRSGGRRLGHDAFTIPVLPPLPPNPAALVAPAEPETPPVALAPAGNEPPGSRPDPTPDEPATSTSFSLGAPAHPVPASKPTVVASRVQRCLVPRIIKVSTRQGR